MNQRPATVYVRIWRIRSEHRPNSAFVLIDSITVLPAAGCDVRPAVHGPEAGESLREDLAEQVWRQAHWTSVPVDTITVSQGLL